MIRNKLKSALEEVYMQELDSIPPQYMLETEYSFSAAFKTRMEDVIKQVSKEYITIFNISLPRNAVVLAVAALILVPIGMLYYTGIIDRSAARFFVAVAEMLLLYAFGTNMRKETRRFTGGYRTAFTDSDEDGQPSELEFSIPVAPEGYVKTNEYRTTVSHMIEYQDHMGRKIIYNRIDIQQGVMTKIDTANIHPERIKIKDYEAIVFSKDNETNLIWADKRYRYHLKGSCTKEMLAEMAQSM